MSKHHRSQFTVEQLVAAMSGRKVEFQYPHHRPPVQNPVLFKVENLSVTHRGRERVREVSFEVRRGEIVGLAGLLGAGRSELLNALYGALPHRGQLYLDDQPLCRAPEQRHEHLLRTLADLGA